MDRESHRRSPGPAVWERERERLEGQGHHVRSSSPVGQGQGQGHYHHHHHHPRSNSPAGRSRVHHCPRSVSPVGHYARSSSPVGHCARSSSPSGHSARSSSPSGYSARSSSPSGHAARSSSPSGYSARSSSPSGHAARSSSPSGYSARSSSAVSHRTRSPSPVGHHPRSNSPIGAHHSRSNSPSRQGQRRNVNSTYGGLRRAPGGNAENHHDFRGQRRSGTQGRRSASTDAACYRRAIPPHITSEQRSSSVDYKDSLSADDDGDDVSGSGSGRRWSDVGFGRVYFDGYDQVYYYNSEDNLAGSSSSSTDTASSNYYYHSHSLPNTKRGSGQRKDQRYFSLVQPVISGVQLGAPSSNERSEGGHYPYEETPYSSGRFLQRGDVPKIYITSPNSGKRRIFLEDGSYEYSHMRRLPPGIGSTSSRPGRRWGTGGSGGGTGGGGGAGRGKPPPYGRWGGGTIPGASGGTGSGHPYTGTGMSEQELVTHAYAISPGKKHTTFDSEPSSPRRTKPHNNDDVEFDLSPSTKRKRVYFDETETVYDIDDDVLILETSDASSQPIIRLCKKPPGILRKTSKYATGASCVRNREESMEEDGETTTEDDNPDDDGQTGSATGRRQRDVDEDDDGDGEEEETEETDMETTDVDSGDSVIMRRVSSTMTSEPETEEDVVYKSPFADEDVAEFGRHERAGESIDDDDNDDDDDIFYGPDSDVDVLPADIDDDMAQVGCHGHLNWELSFMDHLP